MKKKRSKGPEPFSPVSPARRLEPRFGPRTQEKYPNWALAAQRISQVTVAGFTAYGVQMRDHIRVTIEPGRAGSFTKLPLSKLLRIVCA